MTAQQVLKSRARALAQRVEPTSTAGEDLDVVEFSLARERYAFECAHVREVVALSELTPLPCTPAFVCGIVNVRGQIVPVIDIKKFFDLPQAGIVDVHLIVVVHYQGTQVGIEADALTGTRIVRCADIEASLPTLTGIRAQYLRGVTNDHLVILDASKILSDPRLVVDEQVQSFGTNAEKT